MAQLIEFPIKAATRAGNALVQPLRSAWPVHSVDDYGRDPHLISALAPFARLRWNVSVGGQQHLPARTGALLVCNSRRYSLSSVYAALALSEATVQLSVLPPSICAALIDAVPPAFSWIVMS